MKHLFVHHKVADFTKWEPASTRAQAVAHGGTTTNLPHAKLTNGYNKYCDARNLTNPRKIPVPRISEFFGITIYIYFADTNRHAAPHFHAKYGGDEAVYSIPDGDLLAGSLPKRQHRLVQGWAALRTAELEQAWNRAVNMQQPDPIDPLN